MNRSFLNLKRQGEKIVDVKPDMQMNNVKFNNRGEIVEMGIGDYSTLSSYIPPFKDQKNIIKNEFTKDLYDTKLYHKVVKPYIGSDGKDIKFDFTVEDVIEWNGIILMVNVENMNYSNYIELDETIENLIKTFSLAIDGQVIEEYDDYGKLFIYDNLFKRVKGNFSIENDEKKILVKPKSTNTNLIFNPEFMRIKYNSIKKIVNGFPSLEESEIVSFEIVLKSQALGNLFSERQENLIDLRAAKNVSISLSFNENAFFVPIFNSRLDDLVNASVDNSEYAKLKALKLQFEKTKVIGDILSKRNSNMFKLKNKTVIEELLKIFRSAPHNSSVWERIEIDEFEASEWGFNIIKQENLISANVPSNGFAIDNYTLNKPTVANVREFFYLFKGIEDPRSITNAISKDNNITKSKFEEKMKEFFQNNIGISSKVYDSNMDPFNNYLMILIELYVKEEVDEGEDKKINRRKKQLEQMFKYLEELENYIGICVSIYRIGLDDLIRLNPDIFIDENGDSLEKFRYDSEDYKLKLQKIDEIYKNGSELERLHNFISAVWSIKKRSIKPETATDKKITETLEALYNLNIKTTLTPFFKTLNYEAFFEGEKIKKLFTDMRLENYNNESVLEFSKFFLYPEMKFDDSLDSVLIYGRIIEIDYKPIDIPNTTDNKNDINAFLNNYKILLEFKEFISLYSDFFPNYGEIGIKLTSNKDVDPHFKINYSSDEVYIPYENEVVKKLIALFKVLNQFDDDKLAAYLESYQKRYNDKVTQINEKIIDMLPREKKNIIYTVYENFKGLIYRLFKKEKDSVKITREDFHVLWKEIKKIIKELKTDKSHIEFNVELNYINKKCDSMQEWFVLMSLLPDLYIMWGCLNTKYLKDRVGSKEIYDLAKKNIMTFLNKSKIDDKDPNQRLTLYFSGKSLDYIKSTLINEIIKRETTGKWQSTTDLVSLSERTNKVKIDDFISNKYLIVDAILEIKCLPKAVYTPFESKNRYTYRTLESKIFDVNDNFFTFVNSNNHEDVYFYFTNLDTSPLTRRYVMRSVPFKDFKIITENGVYPPNGITGKSNNSDDNFDFLEELAFSLGYRTVNTELSVNFDKYKFNEIGDVLEMGKNSIFNNLNFSLEKSTSCFVHQILVDIDKKIKLFESTNVSKNKLIDMLFDTTEEFIPRCLFGFNIKRIEEMTGEKLNKFEFSFDQREFKDLENKLMIEVFVREKY